MQATWPEGGCSLGSREGPRAPEASQGPPKGEEVGVQCAKNGAWGRHWRTEEGASWPEERAGWIKKSAAFSYVGPFEDANARSPPFSSFSATKRKEEQGGRPQSAPAESISTKGSYCFCNGSLARGPRGFF